MNLDILCLSGIPWEKQAERPQEILHRFARSARVFYVEGPIYQPGNPKLLVHEEEHGAIWSVIPSLPDHLSLEDQKEVQRQLMDQLLEVYSIQDYILWLYNPAALESTRNLNPRLTIYDCISRIRPEDGEIFTLEAELLSKADIVMNDSQTLCDNQPLYKGPLRFFPGSINVDHFFAARANQHDPADQSHIPHPRLGFWGVVNHMFDARLVKAVADARPEWHFVILGPITTDPGTLLNSKNIHYVGTRDYAQYPAYLAGWDVAILPLAWRELRAQPAAAQVSQYLAGGCPVVSTRIPAVVRSFERRGLVRSADTPEEFIEAAEKAMARGKNHPGWLEYVDKSLADSAWDLSWEWMAQSIEMASNRQKELATRVEFRVPVMTY